MRTTLLFSRRIKLMGWLSHQTSQVFARIHV